MAKSVVANAAVSLTLQSTEFSKAVGTAKAEAKSLSATMREESNKSRESVKLLSEELSLGIPRGLQKIISKLPGVSTAMNAAFDAVVVFALIRTVVEVTEKIAEYGKKTEEAARKNKQSWEDISSGIQASNDKMKVTNDKLEEQIAKLEHKPQNGLKTAIDEAVASADELWRSLQKGNQQSSELMEKTQVGWGARILGKVSTDEVGGQATDAQNKADALARTRADNARKYQQQIEDLGEPTKENEAKRQAIKDAQDNQFAIDTQALIKQLDSAAAQQQASHDDAVRKQKEEDDRRGKQLPWRPDNGPWYNRHDLQDPKQHLDYSAIINDTGGNTSLFRQQANSEVNNLNNLFDNQRLTKDTTGNTAAAQLLKSFEDQNEKAKYDATSPGVAITQEQAGHKRDVEDEIKFWEEKISAFSKGSDEYLSLQKKLITLYGDRSKQFEDIGKNAQESFERNSKFSVEAAEASQEYYKMVQDSSNDDVPGTGILGLHQGERYKTFNEEQAKGSDQYNEFLEKTQEQQVKLGQASGSLNAHSAALETAAIHAEAYQRALKQINDQLDKIKGDTSLTPEQRTTQLQGLTNQRAQLGYANSIQGGQDQFDLAQTNFSTRMTEDLTKWAEQATDLGNIMSNLFTTSINQVNDAIIKILTTKQGPGEHPFRQAGHAIFTDATKSGLQASEGGLMKLFGHGSAPKGTASDPLYVKDASLGGGAASAGTGLIGALNDSNWAGGLFGGKLFGPGSFFGKGMPSSPTGPAISEGDGGPLSNLDISGSSKAPIPGWEKFITGAINVVGSAGPGLAASARPGQAGVSLIPNSIPMPEGNDGLVMPGDIEAHAGGGILSANTWSLVGEEGPELLPPVGETTRVYDARDTAGMLGGKGTSHTHHYHVDARGSTDPAAVHRAVMRGIQQSAPHLVAAANQAHHDQKARKPSTKG